MTLTKTTKFKEIYPLSYHVTTMYDKRVFDVLKLRRKFSKLLEVNQSKDAHGITINRFSITSRKTGLYVGCSFDYTLNADVRVCVLHSTAFGSSHQFHFNVSNNKELLQKLIHYNLIS